MSVLMYLRKSRADNPNESVEEVLSKHEEQLQRLAVSLFGEPIPEKDIFREVVSGETIAARPQIQTVLQLMESPDVTGVMVTDPARLTRGDLVDCGTISQAFRYTNTLLYTLGRTYNLADNYDRKFVEQDLLRGADYLDYVKDVLGRGRRAASVRGSYIGSVPPFGYDKTVIDGQHTLRPNAHADTVRLVYQMYVDGLGFQKICYRLEELGIQNSRGEVHWEISAISSMLSNPVYKGMIRWGGRKVVKKAVGGQLVKSRPRAKEYILVPGLHEAIVSEDLWERAQQMRGRHARVPEKHDCVNPFARIAFCGTCGNAMVYRTYNRGISPRMLCRCQNRCKTRSCLYIDFQDAVIHSLEENLADVQCQLATGERSNETLQNLYRVQSTELAKMDAKIEKLMEFLEEGIYTKEEYLRRKSALDTQRATLQDSVTALAEQLSTYKNPSEIEKSLHNALSALKDNDLPASSKQALMVDIIERIVYHNDSTGGRWNDNPFSLDVFLRV